MRALSPMAYHCEMDPSSALTLAFACFLVASLVVKFWLATRQVRHVARHRDAVPAPFDGIVSLPAHQKAADYTIVKGRLGILETAVAAAVLLAWTLLGGLDALNQALLAGVSVIGGLIDLPFSLYQTFVVEERFGFNKMTWKLWLSDFLKSALLGVALGLPLAWVVLWLMNAAGAQWWIWAWGVTSLFLLFVQFIFPIFIAPLFNKFEPLQDEALKERITRLMQRCGFVAKGFFIMDGSKRSAHANAYFTGFGASKRVVFYDTLIARLSPDEVDAVLAHELGHFRLKHIAKRIAATYVLSFVAFALLGWLSSQVWFYTGLGVRPNMEGPNDALALLLFMLALPVFTFFISPLMARFSRKHEFEADAFAATQTSGQHLGSALLKLYEDNASTLTPDPVFVKFYYSHPPASERLARLQA
jgi:STE24 endopeptidase